MLLEHADVHFVLFTFNMLKSIALTVTGALNQRLRPLGQPAVSPKVLLERVVARAER